MHRNSKNKASSAMVMQKLSDPIDTKKLLNHYRRSSHQLRLNLELGCEIVNETRAQIKESTAHPQFNYYTENEKIMIHDKLEKSRDYASYATLALMTFIPSLLVSHTTIRDSVAAHFATQMEVGNSYETMCVAKKKLKQKNPKLNSQIYKVTKGNNLLLVFGQLGEANYLNFGANAVACDVINGAVYPATEIPMRKNSYKIVTQNDGKHLIQVEKMNPHTQTIKPYNRFCAEDTFCINAMRLTLFAGASLFLAAKSYMNATEVFQLPSVSL